jgi:hypothetical protein
LCRFRQNSGFGASPIPLQDIAAYAKEAEITGEDFIFFAEVINACDQVFMEDVKKQQDAKSKSKPSTPGKKSLVR